MSSCKPILKPWVLITGASSGIGEAFVKRFAKEHWNIVLVARSVEKMNALAESIKKEHKAVGIVIGADLSEPDGPKKVYDQVREAGITLTGLINNAGVGAAGKFADVSLDRYLNMIDLNVRALVELTHLFLNDLVRNRGLLINVSSIASFQPLTYSSVYAASKAFVTSFSEALWLELKEKEVRVLNLCPGLTKTNFGNVAGGKDYRLDPMAEPVEAVIDTAFRALEGNAPTVISGWGNRTLMFLKSLAPHRLVLAAIPHIQKIRKGL